MTLLSVLVVDDDALILHSQELALEDAGYSIATALGSQEAVAMLDKDPHEYRALVTDVNMGDDRPTGWDVAKHARELNAKIPVVYIPATVPGSGRQTACRIAS